MCVSACALPNRVCGSGPLALLRGPPTARRPLLPPRSTRLEEASTSGSPRMEASQRSRRDPFDAAGSRVQELLRTVGSGEEELLDNMVAEQTPSEKLQSSVTVGAVVTFAAVVISTLCRTDPYGGLAPTADTAAAAAVGMLAAVPLVAVREWSWGKGARQALPLLDDMHHQQTMLASPWLTGMRRGHVAVLMALEVLPLLLLLLPAVQGVLGAVCGLNVVDPFNDGPPPGISMGTGREAFVHIGGLIMSAFAAGLGAGLQISVTEEEEDVVTDALDNADRFYRLHTSEERGAGTASSDDDGAEAATAFRAVALVYLESRNQASALARSVSFCDVFLQGLLWYATGNLAAPAIVALAVNYVDYFHMHNAVRAKEIKSGSTG